MATIIAPSGGSGGGGSTVAEGTYNATLPTIADGSTAGLELEKDGTLRAGLRPRGYRAGVVSTLYRTGILVTGAGNITITGEDGTSSGSFAVPVGLVLPGPINVSAATATFVGLM
jgi:hypothetical protein